MIVRFANDTMFPPGYYPSFSRSPSFAVALAVAAVISAPILEEFAFRGWIQSALVGRFGRVIGVVVTSAVFAPVHGVLWRPNWFLVLTFVVGLAFGTAVLLTGSIWTSVLAHALANGLTILVPAGVDPAIWLGRPAWGAYASIGLIVLSVVAFIVVCRKLAAWDHTPAADNANIHVGVASAPMVT